MQYTRLLNIISLCGVVNCGVLIISPKTIDVRCLEPFDKHAFDALRDYGGHINKLVTFHLDADRIPDDCEELLAHKHSLYVPNVKYIPENAIGLNRNETSTCELIKSKIASETDTNSIHLLIHTRKKYKRSPKNADAVQVRGDGETRTEDYETVINTAKNVLIEERKIEGREAVEGNAFVFLNFHDNMLLYATKIEVIENGKVVGHFSTPGPTDPPLTSNTRNEYVKLHVKQVLHDSKTKYTIVVNLYSWSCSGKTVCSGGTTSVVFHNLQTQPDASNARFGRAWSCVPFMTIPIWMGLFVTSMLTVILGLGIFCIMNIKTNDKFDNKYLTITVIGE